jgi:hypothetical protein
MALDFPASPTTGQQFGSGTTTWVFDGTAWNIMPQLSPAVASDLPPSNPAVGQLWWRSTNGKLYIYTDDGNSKQWVETGNAGATPGIWEKILLLDFTALSNYPVPNLGMFRDMRFTWDATSASGGDSYIGVQLSADNGATYMTNYVTTSHYFVQSGAVIGGGNGAQPSFLLGTVTSTGFPASGVTNLMRFNKPAYKPGSGIHGYNQATQFNVVVEDYNLHLDAIAANALRICAQPGTTIEGRILIEGIRG